MGDNKAAATKQEIIKLLAKYLKFEEVQITAMHQVDPDATIFSLQIDGSSYLLLEEDYVANIDEALIRFSELEKVNPQLQKVLNPPEAFDPEKALGTRPENSTPEGDDYNRLRLYQIFYMPKALKYPLTYFLAKAGRT